jgi:hypothetical protein
MNKIGTGFDIYEALIINWLKRESNKYEEDTRIDFRLNLLFISHLRSQNIFMNIMK